MVERKNVIRKASVNDYSLCLPLLTLLYHGDIGTDFKSTFESFVTSDSSMVLFAESLGERARNNRLFLWSWTDFRKQSQNRRRTHTNSDRNTNTSGALGIVVYPARALCCSLRYRSCDLLENKISHHFEGLSNPCVVRAEVFSQVVLHHSFGYCQLELSL